MRNTRLLVLAGLVSTFVLFGSSSNAQDMAVVELDRSVVNINTLGDVKLIRTANTPRAVKIIKAREYQASTCTEYTTHQYTGTCYSRVRVPNPRVCNFYETYTTYGPYGSIYVHRRCVSWVGGGTSTVAQPYSCPATREVCSRSAMEMRVGTIEFNFRFRRMHRLGNGEIEEYLLTEENSAGRSSWDFRILDSNGRTYRITRDGTEFELRRN